MSSKKINYHIKKAFTLVELIIVISILSVLTAVFLNAYKGSIQQAHTESSAYELQSILKALQSKAGRGVLTKNPENYNTNNAICHGLHFDIGEITKISSFATSFDNANSNCIYDESKWTNKQDINFYSDVKLSQIGEENLNTKSIDIYFYPPRGAMQIFYDTDNKKYQKELKLTLQHSVYTNIKRMIYIDPTTGKIELSIK